MSITFTTVSQVPSFEMAVFLEGKRVGTIYNIHGKGFHYVPKGQKNGGDYFPTLALCQNSLRG